MNDTWRFIIVVALLVVLGGLLPLAADASPAPSPVACEGGMNGK